MGWTSDFIDELDRSTVRLFVVETILLYSEVGIPGFKLGSHYGLSGDDSANITRIEFEGHSLTPQTWTGIVGAFSVYFAGNPADVFGNIQRGSTLRVLMGFPGWAVADFEPVAMGRVTRLSRSGGAPEYCISCLDAFSATSYQIASSATVGLFGLMTSTTLTAGSAIADGSYDGTAFGAFRKETGEPGGVLVTTSAGDPYFRLYSSTTPTVMTISNPATTYVMGTPDIGASSPDVVSEIAYLAGHPLTIARKVLSSRGAGANGSYDTYPAGWGLGIATAYLDEIDMDRVLTIVQPASGSYLIAVAVLEEVPDARAWLEATILGPFGLFLAMRQGLMTVRAVQDPTATAAFVSSVEITSADIVSVDEWDAWDPDVAAEYFKVSSAYYGGGIASSSNVPATMPAYYEAFNDLSTSVFDNGAAICTEVVGRLGIYYTRIPEVIKLTTTLRLAQLAVGDLVTLTLAEPFIQSRADNLDGYFGRRALVTMVQADFWRGSCVIVLRVYPAGEGAFE